MIEHTEPDMDVGAPVVRVGRQDEIVEDFTTFIRQHRIIFEGTEKKARMNLLKRSLEVLFKEIDRFDESELDALSSRTDSRLIVELAQASLSDRPTDREGRMLIRGAERLKKLLERSGGTVSSKWVADFLQTSEAAVRKRVQRNGLIARRLPSGDLSLPRFQFDERTGGVVPGLSKFMKEVSGTPEEMIQFLLVPHNPAVSRETPLDLLKQDNVAKVVELAELHLQQRP
ncbi:hypothetical protein [Hydrocarboniclastica marina]|uniref:DNA-binding protein n=1 Tax=Hydrocarboniclastica marina TaxID=2259620 RepID=A0A4P7XLG6_9ALTE|nr:hypothetical protein [Hydrocarboniclastica marina]QCF28096.1 hypothetical protein soil367_18660 [Hydrocarboniclastica marina]